MFLFLKVKTSNGATCGSISNCCHSLPGIPTIVALRLHKFAIFTCMWNPQSKPPMSVRKTTCRWRFLNTEMSALARTCTTHTNSSHDMSWNNWQKIYRVTQQLKFEAFKSPLLSCWQTFLIVYITCAAAAVLFVSQVKHSGHLGHHHLGSDWKISPMAADIL